jgi:hypothetical protein
MQGAREADAPSGRIRRVGRALGRWGLSIAIGFDQFAHTVVSPLVFRRVANPDETISSRIGKIKLRYGGTIPWRRPLLKVIDWGLERADKGHAIDAIEPDED